jgi:hypothetical protein
MTRARVDTCASCAEIGRAGSCARLRCYCGHSTCWAFASWSPLSTDAPEITTTTKRAGRSAWDNRKESTWLDRL